MDADIEKNTRSCVNCLKTRDSPPKVKLCPWPKPSTTWEGIHVDFLGPVNKQCFLLFWMLTIKWAKVFRMSNLTSALVIMKLIETFARFGLTKVLYSYNSTQLVSKEFKFLFISNGVEYITSPIFYPSSNGKGEVLIYLKIIYRCTLCGHQQLQKSKREIS